MATAFFAHPSNPQVEHEKTLIDYQTNKVKFNPKIGLHTQLVNQCSVAVQTKLANLQMTDIKMTSGFGVGTAAFLLSFVFAPFAALAIVAFAYASYQLAKRQQAYLDYTYALENLSKCCIWTLGEVDDKQDKHGEITSHPDIIQMRDTLAPLTSTQQLRDFIDDSKEDQLIAEADKIKAQITLFDRHLDKEKADLYFKIYGLNQGGFLAILEGVGYVIKTGFISLKNAITSKASEPVVTTEPVDSLPTVVPSAH